jgi:type 1 glutamine amidotransferase
MTGKPSGGRVTLAICAAALFAGSMGLSGQQAPAAGQGRGSGRGGGGMAGSLFAVLDTNGDGSLTRDELKSTFDKWYTAADPAGTGASQEQIAAALSAAMPQPVAPAFAGGSDPCGGRSAQPTVPCQADVDKMMAALPDKAPAKPKQPRKVLVLAKASGFVHSSIPLAARMMEEMGKKTGAWTATVSYDPAVITADNLKQYDAIFLDNTTGTYLDDPNDAAVTAARRKALLDFVRSGKGLAAIHAAIDSYHGNPAATGRAGGAGRGGVGGTLAPQIVTQGDTNHDQKISRAEMAALADAWFDKLDPDKTGKVSQQDFAARFLTLFFAPAAGGGQAVNAGLWPEYNKMIGAWFKFHWNDPQLITVKIDDPKSPLTAPFNGQSFEIHDETYTYPMESFSRQNVHVLTSVDYAKMSDEDKAKEPAAARRTDGDYALSWIRREGKGRVFVEAHGHSERVYAIRPMLEHILAGVQYALGDLQADDTPSAKSGTTAQAAK